jgi:ribonuclease-3
MEEIFANLAGRPEEMNPKGSLQELLQSISPNAPKYELLSQAGPEHSKRFVCRVVWDEIDLGQGEGLSKKEAQVAAAQAALADRAWEKTRRRKTAKAV